jgi:hypothetical protein
LRKLPIILAPLAVARSNNGSRAFTSFVANKTHYLLFIECNKKIWNRKKCRVGLEA